MHVLMGAIVCSMSFVMWYVSGCTVLSDKMYFFMQVSKINFCPGNLNRQ